MFIVDGIEKVFWSEEQAMQAVMEQHPELGDDALVEYFESHVSEDTPE